jgi:single-stranded-DNA-specific exonuclease
MKYREWRQAAGRSAEARAMVAQGVPPLVAAVLCARGLDTVEKAKSFLAAGRSLLCDPFLMKDMDRAVARMVQALEGGEQIAVYGDYDVDGITATCLLSDYLRSRGGRVLPYIPDRLEEGYGLNREAISGLKQAGVSLIVTVDCGITAVEETAYAASLGIDVIITDHHECKQELPKAVAVVDPHRQDCPYPFPSLAGVGVAFKLVLALGGAAEQEELLQRYSDLAAVGTVADVMCLLGENRTIVRLGLRELSHTRRPGFRALLKEAGLADKALSASVIGYTLAPRINAAGRMGCAGRAAELLLTQDSERAAELARSLCELNRERQAVEGAIYEESIARVDRQPDRYQACILLADSAWHQGVVGIVASRLAEKYHRPAFMICLQDGVGKGSCRSYGGFHLFSALEHCSDLLEGFGGHAMAAGFTVREDKLEALKSRLDAYILQMTGGKELEAALEIDAELEDPGVMTVEEVSALSMLEPYGAGNPRPLFSLSSAAVSCVADVGSGRHMKMKLAAGGNFFDAIFFSTTMAQAGISPGDKVDVAFYPQVNEFRGCRSVQLQVVDLRPALTRVQVEQNLYQRYCQGGWITEREAAALLPRRDDFVGLWRYLKGRSSGQALEETACRLVKNFSRFSGRKESYVRTMVCLEVFEERGLIALEQKTDHLRIQLCQPQEKVDLEASAILRQLRRMAEGEAPNADAEFGMGIR